MSIRMDTGGQNFDHGDVQSHWNLKFSWENPKCVFYYTEFNINNSK